MMKDKFIRNELLLGKDICTKLQNTSILVVGVGGVGGYAIESLARLGVCNFTLVDNDCVDLSNYNRQIIATDSNLNKSKVEAFKERILDINNNAKVDCKQMFYNTQTQSLIFDKEYDFVIDAIDTLTCKWDLIKTCIEKNIAFISSMGMANKIDLTKVEVTTLNKTHNDPVSKKIREFARRDNISLKNIPVVFSSELPYKQKLIIDDKAATLKSRIPPSSIIFTPAVAGLVMGQYILEKIMEQ